MKLTLDAGDFEFLEGNTVHVYEFPPETQEINLAFYSDDFIQIGLETDSKAETNMLWLCQETKGFFQLRTTGFGALHLKGKKTSKIAARVTISGRGERLDPTPLAVTMSANRESLEAAIRRQLRILLGQYGSDANPDEFDLSPLDGDFEDDDDLLETGPYDEVPLSELDDPEAYPEPESEGEGQPEDVTPPSDGESA